MKIFLMVALSYLLVGCGSMDWEREDLIAGFDQIFEQCRAEVQAGTTSVEECRFMLQEKKHAIDQEERHRQAVVREIVRRSGIRSLNQPNQNRTIVERKEAYYTALGAEIKRLVSICEEAGMGEETLVETCLEWASDKTDPRIIQIRRNVARLREEKISYSTEQGRLSPVTSNTYGPGIHSDATGRAFTYQPQYGATGQPDPTLRVQPNAYGPGVGMDQYGRPVRAKRWP